MPPLHGLPPRNRIGITSEAPFSIDLNSDEVTLVDLKAYPADTRKVAASGARTIIGSLIVLGVCLGFLGSFAAHSRSFDRSAHAAAASPAMPQKIVAELAKVTPPAPAAAPAKEVPAPTPSLDLDANPVLDLDDVAKRAQSPRQAQSRFPKRLPPRR